MSNTSSVEEILFRIRMDKFARNTPHETVRVGGRKKITRAVAIHEAGHVVAYFEFGAQFEYVEVFPFVAGQKIRGCVVGGTQAPPKVREGLAFLTWHQRTVFPDIVISYAGPVAQARQCHQSLASLLLSGEIRSLEDHSSSSSDGDNIFWAIEVLSLTGLDREMLWAEAENEAKRLLRRPEVWAAANRIADALQERHHLDYEEALGVAGCARMDGEIVWPADDD